MKLTIILLLTASIICSSSAYPASGNPDNDVELISGGSQPGYQPAPSIPSVPSVPSGPSVPSDPSVPSVPSGPSLPSVPSDPFIPSIPNTFAIPLYPSYAYPAYPAYTPSYFPLGWTYSVFDGFSNFFNQIRNTASDVWSRAPSVRPIIRNYWPDFKTNGSTTSTVKVVGDHKLIINETVHVQQSDFGQILFKVRTVNIKPAEPNDETTKGIVENDAAIDTDVDVDVIKTTNRPTEIEEDDERPNVEDTGDIDGNNIGTHELLDNTNDIIALDNLEQFEYEETPDSAEDKNEIKKQSSTVKKSENIEFDLPSEMISSEESDDKMSQLHIDQKGINNEWAEVELDNSDEQKTNYYQINSNENNIEKMEGTTIDLTNDIAINQMLADQGAAYNPDAEFFDISQYQPEGDASSQVQNEPQQESFDYMPYPHHQTSSDKQSTIK